MKSNIFSTSLKASKTLGVFALAVCFLSSCASYKNIPYFQDVNNANISKETIDNYTSLTIQALDQLDINVNSLNPDASAVFNNNSDNAGANPNGPVKGYLVDKKGEINLPLVGSMKVSGLTTSELSAQLQQKLLTFLRQPTVSVSVANFKVAVLGDVLRPNIYRSASERLTIAEALSLAGDLNVTAKRKNLILVRERDGEREFIPIDLTSKKIFESPYFYLKNNDLLVVQPSKLKLSTVDTGYRNASLIISALSLLAISYSILK